MTVSSLVTSGWLSDPTLASPRVIYITQNLDGTVSTVNAVDGTILDTESLKGSLAAGSDVSGSITSDSISGVIPNQQNIIGTIIEECIVEPFDIESFSLVSGQYVEVGQQIASPAFSATYSKNPEDATLTDTDGTPAKDVSGTPLSFTSDGTFQKNANNESVTFTLSASLQTQADSAQAVLTWVPLVFTGISTNPGPYTEDDIKLLVSQNLSPTAAHSGFVAPINQYIVHVYPASYGPLLPSNFQIGEIGPGDMTEVQTALSVTNDYGITQDYRVARSDHLINITVAEEPLPFTVTP